MNVSMNNLIYTPTKKIKTLFLRIILLGSLMTGVSFSAQFDDKANDNIFKKRDADSSFNNIENEDQKTSGKAADDDSPPAPGDEPVPINGYIPFLLISGLVLIIYSQTKNKKFDI